MSFNQINYEANRAWQQRTRKPLARSTTELKRTPMKQVSKKHRAEKAGYSPVAREYLSRHRLCHHCIEKGVHPPRLATEVHHVIGKEGGDRIDSRFFMAVNSWCHTLDADAIENNEAEAVARGWKISRHLLLEDQLKELQERRGHFPWVADELKLWEEGQ